MMSHLTARADVNKTNVSEEAGVHFLVAQHT